MLELSPSDEAPVALDTPAAHETATETASARLSPATLEAMTQWPVYQWTQAEKAAQFNPLVAQLTRWHYQACPAYRQLYDAFVGAPIATASEAEASKAHVATSAAMLDESTHVASTSTASTNTTSTTTASTSSPARFALPVRLFKLHALQSVPDSEVVKTMLSSGTGGAQSRIVLDKTTAALQTKILSRIVTDLIGKDRLPMLVLDCPATVKDRLKFSARTAGVLGFSMYGRQLCYAFHDDMSLNDQAIAEFIERFGQGPVLLFGFTYIVWLHLVLALEQRGQRLALPHGILIHGGGWKKLEHAAVSKDEFKQRLASVTGIRRVHNYYGMVEQTGTIFMECSEGHLHCPVWADIRVRDVLSQQLLSIGETGLLELTSLLPQSYPGHVLLTEDVGRVLGVDDCPCGRHGVYFAVDGRIAHAEVRGCSDSYSR